MILAFETSTQVCSVAFKNAEGALFEKRISGRSVHSEYLFLFVKELMKEHAFSIPELDAVLVSNGPGSYTGLRIVASAVKGMLFRTNIPLFAVHTLAGFAAQAITESPRKVHAVIDARRTHVYHQSFLIYEKMRADSQISVKEISEFEKMLAPGELVIGTGQHRLSESVLNEVEIRDEHYISALNLLALYAQTGENEWVQRTDIEALNPNYVSSNQVNNSPS